LRTYNRRQVAAFGTWSPAQLRKWGYVAGAEAEYVRDPSGDDPAQLSSDAGAYRTKRGAGISLRANAEKCQRGAWRELSAQPRFARVVHVCARDFSDGGRDGRIYFVVWRIRRFKGSITLAARRGRYRAGYAIRLARRQATRMRRVAH
jgi:hypothetical protein